MATKDFVHEASADDGGSCDGFFACLEIMTSSLSSNMYHWIRLILGGLAMPLALPWLVYRLYKSHFKNKIFKSTTFEDKVVLITGASSGLGEALAHAFYKAGCKVILAARRREVLEKVKDDLMNSCQSLHEPAILTLDLHELKAIPGKAEEALNIYGRIDILVNNGGISFRGEAAETSLEVDLQVMVTNYLGPITLTKAILPSMIVQESGHIVAISSVQGKIAIPFRSAYSASKHATQAFFDTLKAELAHTNIHILVVSPGYVQTNLSINAVTSDGTQYGVMDQTTSTGMDPNKAAENILMAIQSRCTEFVLSGLLPKAAILLRVLWPWLYFYLMGSRAMRLRDSMRNQDDTS